MLKKKCSSCEKKIERKFNYCPWCGQSFKKQNEETDFGMLGKDDEFAQAMNQVKMPFGLDGIFNTLVKQLEKEMSGLEGSPQNRPAGFKIQISTGVPNMQMNQPMQRRQSSAPVSIVSDEEKSRRASLERVEAKSNIRRLPEGVIYEIDAPGVKSKSDVVITKLEQSIEVKAYSNDKCYVKAIPLKLEILGIGVKDDKVLLKVKG